MAHSLLHNLIDFLQQVVWFQTAHQLQILSMYSHQLICKFRSSSLTALRSAKSSEICNLASNPKWSTFAIEQIFPTIVKPQVYHTREVTQNDNGIPYVVRSKFNNGIRYFVDKPTGATNPPKVISFGAENATFFYQEKEWISGRDMYYILLYASRVFPSHPLLHAWRRGCTRRDPERHQVAWQDRLRHFFQQRQQLLLRRQGVIALSQSRKDNCNGWKEGKDRHRHDKRGRKGKEHESAVYEKMLLWAHKHLRKSAHGA